MWKRSNGVFQGRSLISAPNADHTIGNPQEGYYMFLDMSEVSAGESTHLISPGYAANLSVNACFKIFYHMYGLSPGKLRIYTKPLEWELEDVLTNSSYRAFEITGNQGNKWNEQIFKIPESRDEFQIIIEGVATMYYGSHIAIDDLALLQGANCSATIENTTDLKDGIFSFQSCVGRCDESESTVNGSLSSKNQDAQSQTKCDCFYGCVDINTCCSDYRSICVGKFSSFFFFFFLGTNFVLFVNLCRLFLNNVRRRRNN